MTARYRGHCPSCKWISREYARYTTAADAARAHAKSAEHVTHVIDQYGLRVTRSTIWPKEVGP